MLKSGQSCCRFGSVYRQIMNWNEFYRHSDVTIHIMHIVFIDKNHYCVQIKRQASKKKNFMSVLVAIKIFTEKRVRFFSLCLSFLDFRSTPFVSFIRSRLHEIGDFRLNKQAIRQKHHKIRSTKRFMCVVT